MAKSSNFWGYISFAPGVLYDALYHRVSESGLIGVSY